MHYHLSWSFSFNDLCFPTVHIFILILFLQETSIFFCQFALHLFLYPSHASSDLSLTCQILFLPISYSSYSSKELSRLVIDFFCIHLFKVTVFHFLINFIGIMFIFYIEVIIVIFHCLSPHYSISTANSMLKTWFQLYH